MGGAAHIPVTVSGFTEIAKMPLTSWAGNARPLCDVQRRSRRVYNLARMKVRVNGGSSVPPCMAQRSGITATVPVIVVRSTEKV